MSIILLGVFIFASLISIIFGLRNLQLFIQGMGKSSNPIKQKKYLLFSFLHIIFIPVIIFFVLLMISSSGLGGSIPLLQVKTTGSSEGYFESEKGFLKTETREVYVSEKQDIEIQIQNKDGIRHEFKLDILCPVDINCEELIFTEQKVILLNPGVTFTLPLTINYESDMARDTIDVTIELKNINNYTYDIIPLKIIPS